jgi:hypothetical protein
VFTISSHFRPTGKRFEGIYRFTYERELKGISTGGCSFFEDNRGDPTAADPN